MSIKPFDKPIYVTKPYLPNFKSFTTKLEEIWESGWLTNNGPKMQEFELKLSEYFSTNNISIFSNGTLALQLGLQALEIKGEVITTPFTFVATTNALYWNNIRPVFCDIEPNTYNIDPDKIEELITPWTSAILAVHVFGNPCNHEKLRAIADKHNIKLIYDAAHAFGVKLNDRSISLYGDMSMFSFHATKIFHSFEGGVLTFKEDYLKDRLAYLKNFGFENEFEVVLPGTNAKMSEIHALMGIENLNVIDGLIEECKIKYCRYIDNFKNIDGIITLSEDDQVESNYSYMPVQVIEEDFGISRDFLYDKLKEYNVFVRKYFYPIIPDYSAFHSLKNYNSLNVAKQVSSRILTLPIYNGLSLEDIDRICEIITWIKNEY